MSAGLDASTVTPGRMAPVVSLTTPAIVLCANTVEGANVRHANANSTALAAGFMCPPADERSVVSHRDSQRLVCRRDSSPAVRSRGSPQGYSRSKRRTPKKGPGALLRLLAQIAGLVF